MNEKRTYRADDILRYLNGKMSPAEMHAIEKAALDDPFLADAIQGADVFKNKYPQADFSKDVNELRRKVSVKQKRAAVLFSHWWKVAAVLFVVFSGIGLIFLINEKNSFSSKELAKKEDATIIKPEDLNKKDSFFSQSEAVDTQQHKKQPKIASTQSLKNDSKQVHKNVIEEKELPASEVVQPQPAPAARSSIKREDYPSSNTVNPDSVATPIGGWEAFHHYIASHTSVRASDSSLIRTEIVSFLIDRKGRPHSFHIIQSISASHDSLSIRLLENGPGWEPASNRNWVTVKLKF